jgi:hypothetical protein
MSQRQNGPENNGNKKSALRRFLARMKPKPMMQSEKDELAVVGTGLVFAGIILAAAMAGQGGCRCSCGNLNKDNSPVQVEKMVKQTRTAKNIRFNP